MSSLSEMIGRGSWWRRCHSVWVSTEIPMGGSAKRHWSGERTSLMQERVAEVRSEQSRMGSSGWAW
jgi:hypothetical protein